MKSLIQATLLVLVALYITGCGSKPLPANPYKTETIYLYINDHNPDYKDMKEIIKERLPLKTDKFSKNVIVIENKDDLPKDGILIEVSNFKQYIWWNIGVTYNVYLNYTISSNENNLVLVKKEMGNKTRWYGYDRLTVGIVESLQRYINVYSADNIDERRLPVWVDDKCEKNCRNIAKEFRK